MDKEVVISAVQKCLEGGLVDHVNIRVTGTLLKVDEGELTISGKDDALFSIKGGNLKEPNIVVVDLETASKTMIPSTFADILGKEVSVNCYLDKNSEWQVTDVFSKTIINKKVDA